MALTARGSLIAALLLSLASGIALADPAAGIWAEHTQEMAGGMVIRTVDAETCYAEGKAAMQLHVSHLAQRLVDASCTSEASDSNVDVTRYALHCSGADFGDGLATVSPVDDRSMRIDIILQNHATGLDMEYVTDSSWRRPDCAGHH
jgi:hypothetical protein